MVLDAAAIVSILKPGSAKTFQDYARDVFLPYVKSQVDEVQRVDIVWDDYRPGTLKEQTREKRGTGVRRHVAPQNAVPQNWGGFLRLADNKKRAFFLFLAVKSSPLKQKSKSSVHCVKM